MLMLLFFTMSSYAQTKMSREEAAINRAEDRLEIKRLKLVDYKIQIEQSDSLFVAGEALIQASEVEKKQLKQEIKELEKTYRTESKYSSKAMKDKDRSVATVASKDYKEITAKYKKDLKVLEDKKKMSERNILNGERMIDKASKKLDVLAGRLKQAEKSYKDAEKLLNEAKGVK